MTRVAYLGGQWATNIGNAFYNVPLVHLLGEIYGFENVYQVPDLSGWYWRSDNAYDVVADVDADLFVLSGPSFSLGLEMYRPVFKVLREAKARIAFISVGAEKYSPEERELVFEVLQGLADSLAFVATRDSETFTLYKDLPCPVYDGICGSMFLDDAVKVPALRRPPYVVVNVDRRFEPRLRWDGLKIAVEAVEPQPAEVSLIGRVGRRLRQSRPSQSNFAASVGPFDILRTQSGAFSREAGTCSTAPRCTTR